MTDTTVLQTSEAIARRVAELGRQITSDFRGTEQLTLVGALAGCFIFMADLAREIALPVRCEFMQLPQRKRVGAPGEVRFVLGLPLEGQDVLLVEDILDTGITLTHLHEQIASFHPARLATCVLLDKPAGRKVPFSPEYVGFEVPDRWIIGYGLDQDQLHRNLPYLTAGEDPA